MRRVDRCKSAGRWLLTGLLAGVTLLAAAEGNAAPAKVSSCVACHGADGVGKAPQYPNLRGQKVGYLVKQLKAFRAGDRKDPFMSVMAKPLTDADIAGLAAFFSSLK